MQQESLMDMGQYAENDLIPDKTECPMALLEYELKRDQAAGKLSCHMTFVVTGGPYNNSQFKEFMTMQGNQMAVKISAAQMKKYAKAVGYDPNAQVTVAYLDSLIGKQFMATIGISAGNNGYEDSNRIKKFSQLSGVGPASTTPAAAPQQAQAQAQANSAPAPASAATDEDKMPWEV